MQLLDPLIIFLVFWVLLWVTVLVFRYYQILVSYWNEPVLKFPVLIFESDDWGPGVVGHGQVLNSIIKVLSKYTDSNGRHPVMTLGIVLAMPDANKIVESEYKKYYASFLKEEKFALIKAAMLNGVSKNVFDLQLHGLEHYWPDNLMTSLQNSSVIKKWLDSAPCPATENLPSELQSRWIDVKNLPSNPLNTEQIKIAVNHEVEEFKLTFGFKPQVVVPPTFIWNAEVENEWYQKQIKYLVTPGQCFDGRDNYGRPRTTGSFIYNGQKSKSGLTYIVRNDFFEPSLGHTSEMAIESLILKTRLAQPTLLEIHRFNFIGSEKKCIDALNQLEKCIGMALIKFPNLKFMTTYELAEIYASSNLTGFVEKANFKRILVFLERILANQAIRKWLIISGFYIPVLILTKFRK